MSFAGFPERPHADTNYPDANWDQAEVGCRYSSDLLKQLENIPSEPADIDLFQHDCQIDPLGQDSAAGEHFSRQQTLAGEIDSVVSHKFSTKTKLAVGALATVVAGFTFGYSLARSHDASPKSVDPCAEQTAQHPAGTPEDILVSLNTCRQNQTLGR